MYPLFEAGRVPATDVLPQSKYHAEDTRHDIPPCDHTKVSPGQPALQFPWIAYHECPLNDWEEISS